MPVFSPILASANVVVGSGQSLTVSGGATSSNITIDSAGSEFVIAGGTDTLAIVQSGGTQTVSGAGALAISATLSGGTQVVVSGGSARATDIVSGQLTVSSGGAESDALVGALGIEVVYGSARATTVQGVQYLSGGQTFGVLVSASAASQSIAAGTAVSTTVAAGELYIYGGSAVSATIDSGGYAVDATGGSVSAAVLSGGELSLSGGVAYDTVIGSAGSESLVFAIDSGQFYAPLDSGSVIEDGGAQTVSAGLAAEATVEAGGVQTVLRGSASGTVVRSGGAQRVIGGSAVSTTIEGGGSALIVSVESGGTIASGGLEVLDGGTASGTTIESGGTLLLLSGGVTSGIDRQAGGIVATAGVFLSSTSSFSAWQGSARSATVNSGGQITVLSGGTALDTAIGSSGLETIVAGGVDSGAVVASYGTQTLSGGLAFGASVAALYAVQSVTSGGSAVGTFVASGAVEAVASGGSAISSIVGNSGGVTIGSGGSAVAASVGSGGSVAVDGGGSITSALVSGGVLTVSGGSAYQTRIDSGGSEQLLFDYTSTGVSAPLDSGALIDGGTQVVSAGQVFAATVESGGIQSVGFVTATQTEILAGGLQLMRGSALGNRIGSGGSAVIFALDSGGTVSSGGFELVFSGGTVAGTTVESGGTLLLMPGAISSGIVQQAGATVAAAGIVLDSPTLVSAWTQSAHAVLVGSAGKLYVQSGAEAVATVLSGFEAIELVSNGGTDSGASVGSYDFQNVSGGRAVGATVSGYDAVQIVAVGGSASDTTVLSGAGQYVSSGGTAVGTQLAAGGELLVYSSGSATDLTLDANGHATVSGGTLYGANAPLQGVLDVIGGSAAEVTLGFLSDLNVVSGGRASDVTVDGNFANINVASGAALGGTVTFAPGALGDVSIGGTAMPTAVISGMEGLDGVILSDVAYDPHGSAVYASGTLAVIESGQTYDLAIAALPAYASGGFVLFSDGDSGTSIAFAAPSSHLLNSGQSGGTVSIPANNWLLVESGGLSVSATFSGGSAFMSYDPTTSDGGRLYLNSGDTAAAIGENIGTVSAATIGRGGNLINLGLAAAPTIDSGGLLFTVTGSVDNAVIQTSGIELTATSATVTDTVIDGGLEGLADGAVSVDAVINAGGYQAIGGNVVFGGQVQPLPSATTISTTVHSGGTQVLNQSGIASDTTIDNGGRVLVNATGSAVDPSIGGGGVLALQSGGSLVSGAQFFGTGGELDIAGTVLPTAPLSGFATGDRIDLLDIASGSGATATLNSSTDLLTISAGGTSRTLQLAGQYAGATFAVVADGGAGSLVQIACFAAGTRIATTHGEVAVEELGPEHYVYTQTGRVAPVRWVGRRSVDCRRHPVPGKVWPVRIAADAFGPGLPARDLLVSPDHALFVDGVLIPVRCLIDGLTIAQEPRDTVSYWHVELDRHDVVLAEGLPCESYLDADSRAAFANGGQVVQLHPAFARHRWDGDACAPLVVAGPQVQRVRAMLAARRVPTARARPGAGQSQQRG